MHFRIFTEGQDFTFAEWNEEADKLLSDNLRPHTIHICDARDRFPAFPSGLRVIQLVLRRCSPAVPLPPLDFGLLRIEGGDCPSLEVSAKTLILSRTTCPILLSKPFNLTIIDCNINENFLQRVKGRFGNLTVRECHGKVRKLLSSLIVKRLTLDRSMSCIFTSSLTTLTVDTLREKHYPLLRRSPLRSIAVKEVTDGGVFLSHLSDRPDLTTLIIKRGEVREKYFDLLKGNYNLTHLNIKGHMHECYEIVNRNLALQKERRCLISQLWEIIFGRWLKV